MPDPIAKARPLPYQRAMIAALSSTNERVITMNPVPTVADILRADCPDGTTILFRPIDDLSLSQRWPSDCWPDPTIFITHKPAMSTDPCSLYHGFKRINERGCNVKVNGSLYNVDNPDEFFVAVWSIFKLPNLLDRAAYLAACAELGVTPLEDYQTTQYVIGDYDLGTYFATAESRRQRGIPNTLHQRRGFVFRAEQRDAAAAQIPVAAVPRMSGELWEACTSCGAQPVHMPLHLCRGCWPHA